MTATSQSRSRNAWLTACSAVCAGVALVGCGGGQKAAPEPRIEARTASDLADRSDKIADLLADHDPEKDCEAAHKADELQLSAQQAIDEGRVPEALAEELRTRTQELVDQINCVEPPPPPPDEDGGDNGHGKGKGKRKKGGEG